MKGKTIYIENKVLGTGFEFTVYRETNKAGKPTGYVIKIPRTIVGHWQNHSSDSNKSKIDIFKNYNIPFMPTTVISSPNLVKKNGSKIKTRFVLRSIMINNYRELGLMDIIESKKIQKQFSDLYANSERLYRDKKVGVDLLGSSFMIDYMKSYVKPDYTCEVNNVILCLEDVYQDGKIIFKNGDICLIDIGTLDENLIGIKGTLHKTLAGLTFSGLKSIMTEIDVLPNPTTHTNRVSGSLRPNLIQVVSDKLVKSIIQKTEIEEHTKKVK